MFDVYIYKVDVRPGVKANDARSRVDCDFDLFPRNEQFLILSPSFCRYKYDVSTTFFPLSLSREVFITLDRNSMKPRISLLCLILR